METLKSEIENIENEDLNVFVCSFPNREDVYLPGKYEIIEFLWRTNYGCAVVAYDIYDRKTVLVRINDNETSNYSNEESYLFNDMYSESVLIQYMLDNPLSIKFIDEINTKDWHMLITEYTELGTLDEFVFRHNGMCNHFRLVYSWCRQLVDGIYDLHVIKKLAHFDISPQNLCVTKKCDLKLTDFNQSIFSFSDETGLLIQKLEEDCENEKLIFKCKAVTKDIYPGIPAFVSPELYSNKEFDAFANDIWALGCVLFYIITGKQAFIAPTHSNGIFTYIYTGEWILDRCQKFSWLKSIYKAYESVFIVIDKMLKPEKDRINIKKIKQLIN